MSRVIDLTNRPANPVGHQQIDAIMEFVSMQLGETWTCVKLSGQWLFYRGKPGEVAPAHRSKRRFDAALADATGATVTRLVPTH